MIARESAEGSHYRAVRAAAEDYAEQEARERHSLLGFALWIANARDEIDASRCHDEDGSLHQMPDRIDHGLKEIPGLGTEPRERLVRRADEGPENPTHLRAHESEDDDPDAKDGLHVRAEHMLGCWIDGAEFGCCIRFIPGVFNLPRHRRRV